MIYQCVSYFFVFFTITNISHINELNFSVFLVSSTFRGVSPFSQVTDEYGSTFTDYDDDEEMD